MPIVRLTGKVYPESTNFDSARFVTLSWGSRDLGFPLVITFTITKGKVQTVCDLERFEEGYIPVLLHRSYNLVEAYTDLAAFGSGIAFRVEFDTIFRPDGTESRLFLRDEALSLLCKSFKFPPRNSIEQMEFEKVLKIVLGEPALMGTLRDLDDVLLKFNVGPTNCARVLDGLRKAIAPNEKDKKKGWIFLREALNIEEVYANWISAYSTDTRHGDYGTPISSLVIGEIRGRTWRVMDRFIEYRKNGNVKLDPVKFPLLVHDPAFPFPKP